MLTDFNGNLQCPLEFGQSLLIVAKTIDGAKKFQLNLRTAKEKSSAIGLHFSTNFMQDIIIRNSMINGEWGTEEKFENLDPTTMTNPISPGDFFVIYIFIAETKFHISINNRPYCTFDYRLPIEDIRNIELRDCIQTIKQIDHRTTFPYVWPPIQTLKQSCTFSHDCPKLFYPGHLMVITALCYGNPNGQFILSFSDGDTSREFLHFNPRFEPQCVVRNSMKPDLKFLKEERDGGFPFLIDEQFKLGIAFAKKKFLFAVNGKYFTAFTYKQANLLDTMVSFNIYCSLGMKIHVTGIDHFEMENVNCDGFEEYSK